MLFDDYFIIDIKADIVIIMILTFWLLAILTATTISQNITLIIPKENSKTIQNIPVMVNGNLQPQFLYKSTCSCSMDPLYVYEESTALYSHYMISITNLPSESTVKISSKYSDFLGTVSPSICDENCLLNITNNCPNSKYAINRFTVDISGVQSFSYMVNCNPSIVYKPFEWGLLLIILLSLLIMTIASIYNRASSFNGFYVKVTYPLILFLNLIIVGCSVLMYLNLSFFSISLNISGSILGAIGVYVTTNELIWVLNTKINNIFVWRKIRVLDIVSILTSIIVLIVYWSTGSSWIASDIMALCIIFGSIKLFRIDSLKMGTIFLFSVVLLETIGGLIIHYVLKVSYNNLIINDFNNPLLLQLPSITPELFRKCAWLPVLTVIQPGLVISYLRRFDVSRSTWLYLFIGYASQYAGSIAWMLIDISTVHTLPLGLISDPLMLLIVIVFAYKRNENRTLWLGHFHDPDIYSLKTSLVRDRGTERSQTMNLTQLVSDLRVQEEI